MESMLIALFWLHPLVPSSPIFLFSYFVSDSLFALLLISSSPSFPSSSPSLSLSCSVCWQTFREGRNKGRHHCVFTSFSPPPSLLPPPHLFLFSSLVPLKWSFLSCSGCCLLCYRKTTQEPKQQQAPKRLQTKQIPPQNETRHDKIYKGRELTHGCRWAHGFVCARVFLTGWVGAPAVRLCDLCWKFCCFILEELLPFHSSSMSLLHCCLLEQRGGDETRENMTEVERCRLVPFGWATVWTNAAGLANERRHFKAETTIARMHLQHSNSHQNTYFCIRLLSNIEINIIKTQMHTNRL